MLILASASPRRHELLLAAGIDHLVRPSPVPEIRQPDEKPQDFVRRLAEDKARAVPKSTSDIVLGADTVVCFGEHVFGKPADRTDAERMLRALSGRSHQVYTGICLLSERQRLVDLACTEVVFATLTDAEIAAYIESGEPFDKAGAYAIQGLGSKFILSLSGSYANVVGLPVSLVYRHLQSSFPSEGRLS